MHRRPVRKANKSSGAQNEIKRLEQNKGQLPGRLREKRKLECLRQGTKTKWRKKDTQGRVVRQNTSRKVETDNDKKDYMT